MALTKMYSGPTRYLPGQKLDCKFESIMDQDQKALTVLTAILNRKKENITKNIKRLFSGNGLNFSKTTI